MAGRAAVAYVRARRLTAHLLDLPSQHGAAIAARPWLVTALAPVACILLGATACLPPTTLGLGFDPGELAAAGSLISRWSRTELALKEGLRFRREPPLAEAWSPPVPPATPAEPNEPPSLPGAPPPPPIHHLLLSVLVANTTAADGNVLRASVLAPLVDALASAADGEPIASPLSLGRLIARVPPPPPPPPPHTATATGAPPRSGGEEGLERLLVAPGDAVAAWAAPPLDKMPLAEAARFAALAARVAAAADPLAAALAELATACAATGAPPCGVRHLLDCAGDDSGGGAAVACGARCRVRVGAARVDACALLADARPAAAEVRALRDVSSAEGAAVASPHASTLALCAAVAWAERAPTLLHALPPLRDAARLLDTASAARLAAATDATAACAARAARLAVRLPYAEGEAGGAVSRVLAAAAAAVARCEAAGLECAWYEEQAFVQQLEEMVLADARWAAAGAVGVLVVASLALHSVRLALLGVLGSAMLAFPLAFAAYRLLLRLSHIGGMHVLCLFLATALAADDVCVVASHYARLSAAQPPLPLPLRLGRTVRDSLGVVAATSLTTASALAANVLSPLPLVSLFGAFAALLVLALLLLAVLWLPALLLLLDRRHAPRARCALPASAPLWTRASRFFGGRYASWLARRRRLIALAGAALLAAEVGLALRVAPPSGPLSAVPPWHNQAQYVAAELAMNGDLSKVDLRLVLGLEPLAARDGAWRDGGRVSRERDARQLRATGLDACDEGAQPLLRRLCRRLERLQMPYARRDGSSVSCPFGHAFAAAAAEVSGAAVDDASDAAVPREACLAAVAALWEQDRSYGVWWSDEEAAPPVAVVVDAWVPTNLSVLLPAHVLRPAWEEIKAWLEGAAPAPASPLFSGGGAWVVMEAREELGSTARRGFAASLLLALIAAALVTRSLRVALAATACVAASACCFLAVQVRRHHR